ncbi:rna-dependent rna polymerase 1 [Hordeum vulgare]|nr:rna-dependent rna polymerase 1 [Hordeum vulgare]
MALVELEVYGMDVFLTYVKEEGKGLEGVEVLDSEEKVEEMFDLFVDKKILNISLRKATDPSPTDVNMDHIFLEEQIPINNAGELVIHKVSQEGVLYPASDSTLPPVNSDEPYLNTGKVAISTRKNGVEEEEDEDDDEMDKSSSDFEFFRDDHRGQNISYKAWASGEDEAGTGTSQKQREEEDTRDHYCRANSKTSELWEERKILSEEEAEEPLVLPQKGTKKIKPVRKPGPTSKSHSDPEHTNFADYVPQPHKYCFVGDLGLTNEEEVLRFPSRRKSRANKAQLRTICHKV